MAIIEGNIFIAQPVELVFDEVSDLRNELTYNPDMLSAEMITAEPIAEGSQFITQMRSRNESEQMQITYTAYERLEYIRSRSVSNNMKVEGGLEFSSVEGGTMLAWKWDVQLLGNLKLFSPFVAILGNRQEKRIWRALKGKLEAI